jgi:glutamate racemase
MLKIVVFDSGYGGEFFADWLEHELPVVEVIRVIDWRHANELQNNSVAAREIIKNDLRPYIGRVDLIFFANYFISATSLKYFKRKFREQNFLGLKLEAPNTKANQLVLILATKSVAKTINYYNFLFHLKRKTKTITADSWPLKIDDGELTKEEIAKTLLPHLEGTESPKEVILACSQFYDIKKELKQVLGYNISIHDGFSNALRGICKTLKIRGSLKKIK